MATYQLRKAEKHGPLPDEWTIEDHLIALASRVSPLKIVGVDLFTAAVRAFKVLWPGEAAPKSPEDLANRLMESGTRLCEWRESAARAAADEALMVVLSWYEALDLKLFQSYRSNGKFIADPAWVEKRKELAYSFVETANIHQWTEGPSFLGTAAAAEEEGAEEDVDEDEEVAEEVQADEEAEDVATSEADDVIPPPSTEVTGAKPDAPPTSAQASARDLGKALATDE